MGTRLVFISQSCNDGTEIPTVVYLAHDKAWYKYQFFTKDFVAKYSVFFLVILLFQFLCLVSYSLGFWRATTGSYSSLFLSVRMLNK